MADAPPVFPPAPMLSEPSQTRLLTSGVAAAAVARGLGRMLGLMERTETHGPAVPFALRCISGAYLRAVPGGGGGTAALRADGTRPSDPACVFVAQVGGVARHMRTTLRLDATDTPVVALPGSAGAPERVPACVSDPGAQAERFKLVKAPSELVSTLGPAWEHALALATPRGELLSAAPGGELRLVAAEVPGPAELFFLLCPEAEQARVDEFRAANATPQPQRVEASSGRAGAAAEDPPAAAPQQQAASQARAGAAAAAAAPSSGPLPPGELSTLRNELLNRVRNSRDWGTAETAEEVTALLERAAAGQALRAVLGEGGPAFLYDGRSLLEVAHTDGSAAVVRVLRTFGANVAAPRDRDGNTAMHAAALADDLPALELALAASPSDVRATNSHGRTPLHCAALQGGVAIARALLAAGAPAHWHDVSRRTPRELAANYLHRGVVAALDEHARAPGQGPAAPWTEEEQRASQRQMRRLMQHGMTPADAALTVANQVPAIRWIGHPAEMPPDEAASVPPQPVRMTASREPRTPPPLPAAAAAANSPPPRETVSWESADSAVGSRYRTVLCRYWQAGNCQAGNRCTFAHGQDQLRPLVVRGAAVGAPLAAAGISDNCFPPIPFPQQDEVSNKVFDEHGEVLAQAYMRWLGFADAARGGIHAPDGGVDVRATGALAQVKANVRSQNTPRSLLSQFVGDTLALPPGSARPHLLFFTMREYTADAVSYAAQPHIAMCLFRMRLSGQVEAVGEAASALVAARQR